MRISDWSSDVCSSDDKGDARGSRLRQIGRGDLPGDEGLFIQLLEHACILWPQLGRSEEHTSELQSLKRISYAVFCLKQKPDEKRLLPHPRLLHMSDPRTHANRQVKPLYHPW